MSSPADDEPSTKPTSHPRDPTSTARQASSMLSQPLPAVDSLQSQATMYDPTTDIPAVPQNPTDRLPNEESSISLLLNLPQELLDHICNELSPNHIISLIQTSRHVYGKVWPRFLGMQITEQGNFLLVWACERGFLQRAQELVERGVDVAMKVEHPVFGQELTALHVAVMANEIEVVEWLIKSDADPDGNGEGSPPLGDARTREMVEVLVKGGASVNQERPSFGSPLQVMLRRGIGEKHGLQSTLLCPQDVGWFIEKFQANPNPNNDFHTQPLDLAVKYHSTEMVSVLLVKGADPNGRHGKYPINHVGPVRDGQQKLKLILQHGAIPDQDCLCFDCHGQGTNALLMAIDHENQSTVELLIKHGANVNGNDWCRRTPLIGAVRKLHIGIVRLLLDLGADPNHISGRNDPFDPTTPLLAALDLEAHDIELPSIEIVRLLLDHGADPNYQDAYETCYGVLLLRIVRRHPGHDRHHYMDTTLDVLRKYGADPNLCGRDLMAPIFNLFLVRVPRLYRPPWKIDLLRQIIEHGADVNASSSYHREGRTLNPLYIALVKNELEMAEILLANGADPLAEVVMDDGLIKTSFGAWMTENFTYNFTGPTHNRRLELDSLHFVLSLVENTDIGLKLTADFPIDMLAELLSIFMVGSWPSTLRTEDGLPVRRVRDFSRLTNYHGRWGPDGVSGLMKLIQHPRYWAMWERHIPGVPSCECTAIRDRNLQLAWEGARAVLQLSGGEFSTRPMYAGENGLVQWSLVAQEPHSTSQANSDNSGDEDDSVDEDGSVDEDDSSDDDDSSGD